VVGIQIILHPMTRNTFRLLAVACFIALSVLQGVSQAPEQDMHVLKQQIEKESDPAKRNEAMLSLAEKMLAEGQIADADHFAALAIEGAKGKGAESQLAHAMDLRGEVCRTRFDYVNALSWYAEAQKVREKTHDQRGLAKSEYLVGQVLFSQQEADKALPHLTKSLELFTSESNLSGQAKTRKLLGEVYLKKQVFGSAQEHIRAAIDAYVELNDHASAAQLASRLGRFCNEIGDTEGALVYFRQSFNLHVGANDKQGMALDFIDLGKTLAATQQHGEAQSQLEAAQAICTELADTLGLAEASIALAKVPGTPAAALLTKAGQLLDQLQPREKLPELYATLANNWSAKGNTAAAYQALFKSNQLRDAVAAQTRQKELLELDMRYQSQIAEDARRSTIERLEMQQDAAKRIRWALLGLLAFGGIALWSTWSNYRLKKKDNLLLQDKNKEIELANSHLNDLNNRLDETNQKLVNEIAEREMLETNVFEKDKFLAIVSREMKQPLQQIIGATTRLAEGGPKQLNSAELNEMQFSASNLLVFINDMLDYNKIETGKLHLESHQFDPANIFNEVRERFAHQFREQGITFRMEYDSAIPTQLIGDPVRLNQVVSKLLQHLPIKPEMQVVTLSVMHGERTANQIKLDINISGLDTSAMLSLAGIHNQSLDQSDPIDEELRTRNFSLAMVQRLVQIQDGIIKQSGSDHQVQLQLPFATESAQSHPEKLTKEVIQSAISGKRILVVEDNKINQLVVSNLLKSHGALVVTADDGEEGVAQMQKHEIDLVLMDIQLPKLDGYRATAEIRKLSSSKKNSVAIVALTASAYLTDKDKAELFQMNDHIGKPFSPEELLGKIVEILASSSAKAGKL
jgi:CheY-like chemotaxis protein